MSGDDPKKFPMCAVCRKQSDGSAKVASAALCGTHYDAWLASPERKRQLKSKHPETKLSLCFSEFVARVSAELRNYGLGR